MVKYNSVVNAQGTVHTSNYCAAATAALPAYSATEVELSRQVGCCTAKLTAPDTTVSALLIKPGTDVHCSNAKYPVCEHDHRTAHIHSVTGNNVSTTAQFPTCLQTIHPCSSAMNCHRVLQALAALHTQRHTSNICRCKAVCMPVTLLLHSSLWGTATMVQDVLSRSYCQDPISRMMTGSTCDLSHCLSLWTTATGFKHCATATQCAAGVAAAHTKIHAAPHPSPLGRAAPQ